MVNTDILIIIALFSFVIIIAIILIISLAKKRKRDLENNTSIDKNNNKINIKKGANVSGTYQNISYKYRYFRGAQNSPPSFHISIDCESHGDFKISRETKFDRFFKKIGIAYEMETNDPEFDSKYYIASNTQNFPERLLNNSEIRKIINSIFNRGFTILILRKNKLSLKWIPYRTKSKLDRQEIEEFVAKLEKIKNKCVKIYPENRADINTNWKKRRLFAFLFPGTLVLIGVFAFIFGLINYPPLDKLSIFVSTLKLSIPAFFIFIWIAVKLLKGRSSSHRELIIVFFIAITAFPAAFSGGKIFLNGWIDKSEPRTYRAEILKKYYKKSKNNKAYYIKIRSWRENRETEKLSISRKKYRLVIPGDTKVVVTTKEGKFGYEWIVNYHME